MGVCVRHGIQSKDKNEFHCQSVDILQGEDKFCVFTLWHIAMIYTLPIWGIEEYKPYPHFVLHVLTVHICPHFECVDVKIVHALIYILEHTFSHTIYTRVLALNASAQGVCVGGGGWQCMYCKVNLHVQYQVRNVIFMSLTTWHFIPFFFFFF